jgi:CubicO group peptidase (beta-lactamase class C family)
MFESSYLRRYILLNTVDILDYQVFPSRPIQNDPPVFHFSPPEDETALLPLLNQAVPAGEGEQPAETIDQFLERNRTTAFLVIRDGRLLIERYYNGFARDSICTSFSTAKSFVSALIGIALNERLIGGLDDPLISYLPDLSAAQFTGISIRHLVSMSSGLRYNQHGFLPWDDEPRVYYSPDLRQLARQARRAEPPGLNFHYNNYNPLLLGMLLERVTGGTASAYLQEKIWKPLGMEAPASWSLDSPRSGMEKMESGLNAWAIDFAKFGQLYLQGGAWGGKQIVPESWVHESTTVEREAKWSNYKYLWWIVRSGRGRFMAVGNLGQFIYVAPDKGCVIARFGRARPKAWQSVYPKLFAALVERL